MSLVLLLSGPNLNLLGEREPTVYGTDTLADHVTRAESAARRHGLELEHLQSNHEGDLIQAVHEARGRADALVINAGALSHTSWSLHDAVAAFDGPVVELHISNPAAASPSATPRCSPRSRRASSQASAASVTSSVSMPSPHS